MNTPRWLRIAAAIIAALAAGLAAYTQVDGGSGPAPPAPRIVHRATAPPAPPPLAGAEHENMAEPGDVDLGRLRGAPPSGDTLPGCVSRFNTNNFSSRNGAAIRIVAAHYTVSPNVPGWADVNANADFLNLPSTRASAQLIIDAEGNCLYAVPLERKAWTQAGGNPFTAGIEFVATGSEGKLAPAQLAKGGLVIAAIAKREHIKIQLGDVTGCQPVREGVVDHAMFGPCGGDHHDLRPEYGSHVPRRPGEDAAVLAPLIAAARTAGVTATDRVTCGRLNAWRRAGRPRGQSADAVRRRKALTGRGVTCTPSGPVLTG